MLKQETLKEVVEAMDEGRNVRFITNLPDSETGGRIYEVNSSRLSRFYKVSSVIIPSNSDKDFVFFLPLNRIFINPENVIGIEIY